MRLQNSSLAATTISAAADGVGARRSATKSAMVTSVSWPTAEMTGTGDAAIARATTSSLKAQRSSIDPPPRPTMMTSTPGTRPIAFSPRAMSSAALFALNPRRPDHDLRVRVPAAEHLDDVADRRAFERRDDPDFSRQRGQRPLPGGVEQPFALQALLELIEGELQRPESVRLEVLAHELILALGLVDRDPAARDDA